MSQANPHRPARRIGSRTGPRQVEIVAHEPPPPISAAMAASKETALTEHTRDRLLSAAVKCFAKYGYEGTSFRQIANEAGASFQLIRYHFGSKDALWREALVNQVEDRIHRLKGMKIDRSGDLVEQLRDHLRGAIRDNIERPELRQISTQEYLARSERYDFLVRTAERFVREASAFYSEFVELGVITRFTVAECQMIVRTYYAGLCLMPFEMELALGESVTTDEAIEQQADMLVNLLVEGHGAGLGE
jgi:TetR/AcrR family transcriptional regulator